MRDAAIGEKRASGDDVCQPADTPYRATHAIFVREGVQETFRPRSAKFPPSCARRLLSLRAFDAAGMMVDADVVEGRRGRSH